METDLAEAEELMTQPDFWDDQEKSQKVIDHSNQLKHKLGLLNTVEETIEENETILLMLDDVEDPELFSELESNNKLINKTIEELEIVLLLSEEYDSNNAILELHPGAGGTESQDWGEMLYRMYTRWIDKKGFSYEIIDYQDGDEAGIKGVSLLVKGENAYGLLKAEKGIHRLVRISPFDSSGRRHTSFVSCEITPEIDQDINIEIDTEDLRIDTYRASGAGGQHVNKTDSAVRITHQPTGIVVQSQSGRSQLQNREQAMTMLKSKLYQKEVEEKEAEMAKARGEQKDIGWGSQIRSYVFHPYKMVKDHRTNIEAGNVDSVMDGDLDQFIEAYLRTLIDL